MPRARRKDLERVPVAFPEEFIAEDLVPTIEVENRDQHHFYKAIENGGTATVGRGNSTAMTSRAVVSAEKDETLVLKEDRAHIPQRIVDEHGVKFADNAGATSVKTTLAEKYETDVATDHLGGTGHINVTTTHGNSVITAVAKEENGVKRIAGKKYFVTNKTTYDIIMGKAEITAKLAFTGVAAKPGEVVRGLKPEILAEILGVDKVLVGDDDYWNVGDAHTGKACIVKVGPKNLGKQDILMKPYGKVRLQLKNGDKSIHKIFKDWDKDLKAPIYDAEGYDVLDTLNAECIVKFSNIAADA